MTDLASTATPRADATRQALLEAGLQVFGRDGYTAASMRTLAREAGVNQALIAYHFGGKQGLYLSVFDYVAGELDKRLGAVMNAGNIAGSQEKYEHHTELPRQQAVDRVVILIRGLVQVLTRPDMSVFARLIIREQMDPSEAFLSLWNGGLGRVMGTLTKQVAIAHGHSTPNKSHRLTALTLVGQVLVFRVARATVSRHLNWPTDYTPAQIRQLEALLESNVRALLDSPEET